MRWSAMKPGDKRAVILGALALLPFVLFIWVVRPYRAALSDARDQLEAERTALSRERAAVATARDHPQLQHAADSAMRTMRSRLFEGKDDVMASSELAAYLGDVAQRSRVWLQDAGTRPAVLSPDGVRMLRVEIRAESDLLGTLMFIQGLERGEKLVRVERLDISKSARGDDKNMETLSIAATISGFAVGDSTTAAVAMAKPTVASTAGVVSP